MEEWDTYMKDFVPEDFISLSINPKTEEVYIPSLFKQIFYEDVLEGQSVYMRGAYFVQA